MRRIVLDLQGGLLAEAVMQVLAGYDPDFIVYRSSKPEDTLALCRSCHANVLVMEVIRQGIWKLSERIRLCSAVKNLGWDCKVLLLVDENADEQLAAEVRQTVKDQLADDFIYASVSPTYLAFSSFTVPFNVSRGRDRHTLKGTVKDEKAPAIYSGARARGGAAHGHGTCVLADRLESGTS